MTKDNNQNKTLSIRISTDGFCFCSYTPSLPDSLKYFFYKTEKGLTLSINLMKAIEQCRFVSPDEKYDVKVVIETEEFTTVPVEYDNKQDYKAFHRHCFPKNDARNEIVANRLNAMGLTVLFPVEKNLYERLQQLGDVTYYSTLSILLGLMTSKPVGDDRYMLAYFQGDLSFFISMQGGKMKLANAFRCDNGHDSIYYLLNIWKEQGLSQEDDLLLLCGDKGVEANKMTVARFIKRCRRLNANELFPSTLLNKMDGIPFDLQSLMLCE
ncbi:MAG: DUF3822 family protein [Bacteroidaceae bacterium]|nr:DUF3822 family protein [Bacteroidaceae bacterium]